MNSKYNEKSIIMLKEKLKNMLFINAQKQEFIATEEQVEKMLALCLKRNRPSYYKLRHASGMSAEHTFKGVNMYSDDGKKMRRFESGLRDE